MRTSRIAFLLILLCSGVCVKISRATTIFSDFGAGNTYSTAGGWTIELGFVHGAPFIPSGNYDLTQIDLGVTWFGGTNSVMVSLYTDSSGVPGSVIESWTLTSLPAFGSTSSIVQTLTPTSVVPLNSGHQYWIVLQGISATTEDVWDYNSTGAMGTEATLTGTWGLSPSPVTLPAYDVLGTPVSPSPVPEPSTLVLMGTGLAACLRKLVAIRS